MSSETPWIPVGDLAKGFEHDSYSLSPTNALAGKTLSLSYEDGRVVEHRFTSESALTWTVTEGAEQGRTATEQYRAIEIREGIYFVDLVKNGERATSLSIVLDLCRGICTAVIGRLPDEARARTDLLSRRASSGVDLTPVEAAFLSGAIDAIFTDQTPRHEPTADLVGRRVQYIYSPTEAYEHIYLNQQFYTWHCLRGVEKGLADTDRCHYYKLGDELYLFVWREKLIPTLGVVVVDYQSMRSNGKIFGYEGEDFGTLSNFPVGSAARLQNVTVHP
ncbi:MAG: molybdenum cofactor biosynthesis F family protein [Thermoleophilia bacterium]|nr:molybdenum cofactor biosynthesis F family protein [Thermoleophilia bacterium]